MGQRSLERLAPNLERRAALSAFDKRLEAHSLDALTGAAQ